MCQIGSEMGTAKPASDGFLMTGHTGSHFSRSSEPPMFNRVCALDSFVLLACSVVSVFLLYRVTALPETISTNYRLCICEIAEICLFLASLCDASGRRSRKDRIKQLLSWVDFCGCHPTSSVRRRNSLLWR